MRALLLMTTVALAACSTANGGLPLGHSCATDEQCGPASGDDAGGPGYRCDTSAPNGSCTRACAIDGDCRREGRSGVCVSGSCRAACRFLDECRATEGYACAEERYCVAATVYPDAGGDSDGHPSALDATTSADGDGRAGLVDGGGDGGGG